MPWKITRMLMEMLVKLVDMGSWRSKKIQYANNTGRRAGESVPSFKKWFTQIRALFGIINLMNTKKRQTSRDRQAVGKQKRIQSGRI
jgi:hypothetical protein